MTSKRNAGTAGIVAVVALLGWLWVREYWAYQHPIPPRENTAGKLPDIPKSTKSASGVPIATPLPPVPDTAPRTDETSAPDGAAAAAAASAALSAHSEESIDDNSEMADGVWTDEALEKLIQSEGSVRAAYQKCDRDGRESLIDYLMAEEKLRANLPDILISEADTDLRAYMLLRVEPEGYFAKDEENASDEKSGANEGGDEADADASNDDSDKAIDVELGRILDEKPSTEMGTEEWKARLELALLLGEDYAARWVRDALEQNPDNAEIRVLASLMLLNLAAAQEGFGPADAREAQAYLCGRFEQIADPQERIRAYQALLFAPDREAALASLRSRLSDETNTHAQRVLERIITALENPPEGGAQLLGTASPQPAGT